MNDAINTKLLRCPFCSATPHQGPDKVQRDQLHGEPFQRYLIWCPKGHAKVNGMTREQATEEWNTRALRPEPSAADAISPATEVLARPPSDDLLAFAIVETFGERCPTVDSDCYTCKAWAQYDAILALPCADEAAIRADEREKCAAWHDVQADALEAMIDAIAKDGGWVDRSRQERVEFHRKCASAIRNGGPQP